MIKKPAQTKYPINKLIANRWSPVSFDAEKMVESDKIGSLLEAARWASSCYNEQPWSFIIASKENPEEYGKLLSCLVEDNQKWAKNAPLLMITVAKLTFTSNTNPNRHAYHDIGLAIGNLAIQAQALDLIVHQMAGFEPDKARQLYQIPEDYDPVTAIAVGYQGDVQQLEPDLQKRELSSRNRKPLEDFVFCNQWGNRYFR
jgi:nitroreductase